MKYLRYNGGFRSVNNTLYTFEIWQESEAPFVVQDIAVTGDEHIEIEWQEVDKLEPVRSSKATLTLFSDTDRQFVDLYTIAADGVRLDVMRDGALYWSGYLDPELYEEPFSYKKNYEVSLTFSDFAILDRLKWSYAGFLTLQAILDRCLAASGINYIGVVKYISTKLTQYTEDDITSAISVLGENFFDEDGEAMTYREVLDEVLRAFSLHLQQKAGNVFVFDLNAVKTALNPEPVAWSSDDAVLSVDKVYNNVTMEYSPYEQLEVISGKVDEESIGDGTDGYLVRTDTAVNDYGSMSSPEGFRIKLSDAAKGNVVKGVDAKYFRINPVYSGNSEAGVAWTVKIMNASGSYTNYLNAISEVVGRTVLTVDKKSYIADSGYFTRQKYQLRVNLSLLFDTRYNPFEQDSRENESGDYDDLQNWCNFSYVPFLLTLRDESGNALYHWENKGVMNTNSYVHSASNCKWVAGEGQMGDAFLCWYDYANRQGSTGLGGWQTNKHIIGYYRKGELPSLVRKKDDGEYIDLPPVPGWLELKIGSGVQCYDYKSSSEWKLRDDIYSKTRWVLYKDAAVTLVDKYGREVEKTDIIHNAWINKNAKESLEVKTILGTLSDPNPVAYGQIFKTSDKSVITELHRAGRTDRVERLNIGTIYSNYASRHNILTGTAEIVPLFCVFSDINEQGVYLSLSEVQHLRQDESVMKIVAISSDEYEAIEYQE
ncbi:hypothetical protein [Massilibacteroides sp.]|uniref:hypothetical protein n=1 Tax=Massilibacteroides sp. TaxID=2034766 RepID=UPI002602E6ED|nr:hypothetical protein [Massilibacteroides sp.]MDD4516466.1 hypothetical protein [Massilibacteroides sp.]